MVPEWDIQTTYGVARIEADPACRSGRFLYLDDIECSYVDLADPRHLEFSYIRRIVEVVDLIWPGRAALDVLHLGGGGFTLPRYLAATRPRCRQTVYELDGGLVEAARQYLGLRTSPGLRVRVGDARERLRERPPASADLMIGDAFEGVAVPAQLATVEFAVELRRVLRPSAVYLLNVIDCPPLRASRAEAAVLLGRFQHVALIAAADLLRERDAGNVVFVAADAPLPLAELRRAAARGPLPDVVLDRAGVARFAGSARAPRDVDAAAWRATGPRPDLSVPLVEPGAGGQPG